MKKIYFLAFALAFFAIDTNAQIILQDDFESYSIGNISAQADHFRTWSGTPSDDADVVLDFSNSGDLSLLIDGSGVTDVLLLIPGAPTSGIYTVQWFTYIPTGKGGYFNMQASLTADGVAWNQALMGGNVYFNCDEASGGTGGVTGVIDCSVFDFNFTYPEDEWFKTTAVYDLDGETWSLDINDVNQFSNQPFEFGGQVFFELAAINLFSASTNNEMYIDDLTIAEGVLSTSDFDAETFKVYPNPVKDILNIQSNEAVNNVAVYNVLGQNVYSNTPNTISPTVNMSTFKSGIYFVEVTIGNTTKTVKVVK